jgi:hypothetical protein
MIPTNSVDHSRFPGKTWHASRTLNGPDERRGAVPACTPGMPGTRLNHTDHNHTCAADLLLCPPARLCERRSVPERSPYIALLFFAPEDN